MCTTDKTSVYTLGSGSSGNSVYIRHGHTEILIDAGIGIRALNAELNELGSDLSCIDAIFVTHEHSDHIKALERIARKYAPPIHVTGESAAAFVAPDSCLARCIVEREIEFTEELGELKLSSFRTPHDSAMSVGYIIETPDERIGLATDLGYVSRGIFRRLSQCSAVILEANYDAELLLGGRYPESLKRRVMSNHGHLSNDECARCVCALRASGVKRVLLAHLSEENNTPQLAYDAVSNALLCESGELGLALAVAERYGISKLI